MAWELDPKEMGITLPAGFALEEDEDFVYVKNRAGERVANFSSKGAIPEEIEKAAWDYQNKNP